MTRRSLRKGDLVEVRSAAEIQRTLDENGSLDGMPFMPEMAAYCGRRFRVDRRAEKLCDTITNNLQSRRLADAVYLDELRCDGGAHGGCQAECRFYWKEAWLRPIDAGEPVAGTIDGPEAERSLLELVVRGTSRPSDGPVRYRCQATEMVAATTPLSTADPRPYVRELTSRNVTVRTFGSVMARAAVMQPLQHMGRLPTPPLKGPSSKSPAAERLDLQPGEWVRVKSRDEVRKTLTEKGANRGLWFDREMMALCGRITRVRGRVERIVDERTGEMIELTSDCVKLEAGVCSGELSTGRWFCPREIYSYWRECWLERVTAPVADGSERGTSALSPR
jgi:hypothetical protein